MFESELAQLDQKHLRRKLSVVESCEGAHVTMEGRRLLLMCSNDYLGIANHPALREAACSAMERYGFGAGSSRLVSGTTSPHHALEQRLARFKGTEAAIVFNSGYAANTGIIPAIAGREDVILSDNLNHASIIDGCRMSRGKVLVYRHRDVAHVEQLLIENSTARRKLIVTDGVFSMDGDIAPLAELASLASKYAAILMVDDAHGTGVLGKTGKGTAEHLGVSQCIHIQMGTLSKAFGSFGAYAAGSRDLIDLLLNRARSFMYTTALPPAVCAASIAALDILDNEPERRKHLWNNRSRFVHGLTALGISTGTSETPIVPIMTYDSQKAIKAADKFLEHGIYVSAIRPPTVPDGSARLRTTVTTAHANSDIDKVLELLADMKHEGYFHNVT